MKTLRLYIRGLLTEMATRSDFINTYTTAQAVHKGHKRRSGGDYFDHTKEVRNIVARMYPQDRIAQLAALLHDTLEDYHKGESFSSEEEVIDEITKGIQDPSERSQVLATVKSLTHDKSIAYDEYLVDLSSNQTALRVKMADMLHNSKTGPSEKQLQKYKTAFEKLLDHYDGSPPGISSQHVAELEVVLN